MRSLRECTNENRILPRDCGGRVDACCVRWQLKQRPGRQRADPGLGATDPDDLRHFSFRAGARQAAPDDLLQMGSALFVVYQDNNDNPDGTVVAGTSPQSEVIEYDMSGNVLQTFDVPGHPDGLLAYNATTVVGQQQRGREPGHHHHRHYQQHAEDPEHRIPHRCPAAAGLMT